MKRSKFSLSHYKLLTMDMGKLVPVTWYEAIPGDTIQQRTAVLVRVSPLLAPVMHPVIARIHHWFVPLRLIWEDFEDFITGGEDGLDASVAPYKSISTASSESSLYDYLGVPPASYSPSLILSALPFRAYQLIFNEHYRDQDLVTASVIDTGSGADSTTDATLKSVSWPKDYFTTARPWEQKGAEVTIPLGDSAPIIGIGMSNTTPGGSGLNSYETDGSGATAYTDGWDTSTDGDLYVEEDPNNTNYPNIRADLSAADGVSIADLRLALAIQNYQEARAKYGSRYVEYLKYLGVTPSDQRLQKPEYLGGGRQVIQFSEVLASDGSNTGSLYGHGISAMRSNRYRRFIPEHGIIMTLMSVVPKAIYATGLHRGFSRTVKEDYFQKELQFIGEQEVYNKEVYTEDSAPDGVFGYQQRYDEYRWHPSSIAGEFRTSLDHWHFGRIIGSDPALNSTFITCNPTKEPLASSSTDALYVMANHSIQARRMLQRHPRARIF